jgi:hypothetical protein
VRAEIGAISQTDFGYTGQRDLPYISRNYRYEKRHQQSFNNVFVNYDNNANNIFRHTASIERTHTSQKTG